jgi:predicted aldo/keto reductase-like oxidoreductase
MQYRSLGGDGFMVSSLAFGAMRLPTLEDGKIDLDKALPMFHRLFEEGVNYVDSAYFYHGGESEVVVGKAIKGWRDKVRISTKNPFKGDSGKEWMEHLETQMKRLDTDYIDYYLFHGLQWTEFTGPISAPDGPMAMARKALDEGMIGHICLSCHDTPENMIKLIDTGEFATITMQYNLLDRRNEPCIARAHEKGMGVIIMGPVGGGRLAPPSETIAKMIPGGAKSTPEVALRFVLSNPGVSTALSGMSTMEQIEENLVTCSREEPLSPKERKHVEAALEEIKALSDLYCTGCKYCLPCPQEVNIPLNFEYMNLYRVYNLLGPARFKYKEWQDNEGHPWFNGKTAARCVQCGECEPKCPQNIKIMEQLREVDRVLGPDKEE